MSDISYLNALNDPQYYTKSIDATDNTLIDIVDCLKLGDVVVLTIGEKIMSIYYRTDLFTNDIGEYLTTRRVIFLDVSSNPGLVDEEDGWHFYLCQVKNVEKETNKLLLNYIINNNIPYKYSYGTSFGVNVVFIGSE